MKLAVCILLLFITHRGISQSVPFEATVYDSDAVSGYYLVPFLSKTLAVLDKYGTVANFAVTGENFNFCLSPRGAMAYTDAENHCYFMDSALKIIDSLVLPRQYLFDPREIQFLPNGHFLVLANEKVTMNLSGFCCWKGLQATDTSKVICGVILELDSNRHIVFQWHARDHFTFSDVDTFYPHKGVLEGIDWTHFNSVGVDSDGNLLLSVRNFNEITKINRSTGAIMWRMGGNRNQFKFINFSVPFHGQHDVRRIDNGHITVFDGGSYTVRHGARAIEMEVDEVNKIATLKWSYTYDSAMYSIGKGGNVQRIGKYTLVNFAHTGGKGSTGFVVVDPAGKEIFELKGSLAYRVMHYDKLPWQLNRPLIQQFDSLGAVYLELKGNYTNCKWNDGRTDRVIRIDAPGDYSVCTSAASGAYCCSEKIRVTAVTAGKK